MSAYQFQVLRTTRNNILKLADNFSSEHLNLIPPGFNNSLAWNIGHVLVTQQLLFYRMSGSKCYISEELIDKYKKGTKPMNPTGESEMEFIKQNLMSTIDYAIDDLAGNKFREYKAYQTSYGIELKSIGDAIIFNNLHEGLHLGYMMAMKKLI